MNFIVLKVFGRVMYCFQHCCAKLLKQLREFHVLNKGECYWDLLVLCMFLMMSLFVFEREILETSTEFSFPKSRNALQNRIVSSVFVAVPCIVTLLRKF